MALNAVVACDGAEPIVDGGPLVRSASSAQIVAYEGQPDFVTVIEAPGVALDDAEVEVDGPLEVREVECVGSRCAVRLSIRDLRANAGFLFPAPSDAENAFVTLRPRDGTLWRALISVLPLDAINLAAGSVEVAGARLAASGQGAEAAELRSRASLRWVVFGDLRIAGTIDVSAELSSAGPGGWSGGAPVGDGEGPGAGGAGRGGAGAGGGGHLEAGADGEGEGAGEGGAMTLDPTCYGDFLREDCGGSGGGGAEGAGGAGGGMLLLVSLGHLDLSGARLLATGGAGEGNGGGGAGGVVWIAAPRLTLPESLDVGGGEGDGLGGAGGAGLRVVQAPGVEGVAVDLDQTPAIVRGSLTLVGSGPPGHRVRVSSEAGIDVETEVEASGRFEVEVAPAPGLHRIRIEDLTDSRRSWVGRSLELTRIPSGETRPVGAFVDVAVLE